MPRSRPRRDPSAEAHDPQQLTLGGKISALIALGRIPLASEVPLWCLFGCLTSSQIFEGVNPGGEGPFRYWDWWATLQCMLIVWGTNVSINYANEYFDYDLDRPGMVSAIQKDVAARRKLADPAVDQEEKEAAEKTRGKIMGSTTRIIHDGTFPPLTTLILAIVVQLLLVALICSSRMYLQFAGSRPGARGSPFHGLALSLGIWCTFLSQSYVGPPLRLHYNGLGEVVSAFLLAPVSFLFGILGHYTAITGRTISLADALSSSAANSKSGCYLDRQVWCMFASFYCYQQARVLIMHIHDIEADTAGGKITFCVRVGRAWACRCYLILNALCGLFTYTIFHQLKRHEGMALRVGGKTLDWATTEKVGMGWKTGAIVIGTYALPVVLVTSKCLFASLNKAGEGGAADPAQVKGEEVNAVGLKVTSPAGGKVGGKERKPPVAWIDKAIYAAFPSWIPNASPGDLATLVSVASLFTPVILSLVLTVTVKAVGVPKA